MFRMQPLQLLLLFVCNNHGISSPWHHKSHLISAEPTVVYSLFEQKMFRESFILHLMNPNELLLNRILQGTALGNIFATIQYYWHVNKMQTIKYKKSYFCFTYERVFQIMKYVFWIYGTLRKYKIFLMFIFIDIIWHQTKNKRQIAEM